MKFFLTGIKAIILVSLLGHWLSCGSNEALESNKIVAIDRHLESESSDLVLEFSFGPAMLEPAGDYSRVTIPNLDSLLGKVGAPMLPKKTVGVLVPFGQEIINLQLIVEGEISLKTPRPIQPMPPAIPLCPDCLEKPLTVSAPDPEIYGQPGFFPMKSLVASTPQRFRGYTIVYMDIFPVRYSATSGELIEITQGKIALQTALSPKRQKIEDRDLQMLSLRYAQQDQEEVLKLTDDSGFMPSYSQALASQERLRSSEAEEYQYLIITNQGFADYRGDNSLYTLLEHKKSKGLSTKLVTVEWIQQNQSGEDIQEKIRNFIRHSYQDHLTRYVLLAGDSDHQGRNGDREVIVPFRSLYLTSSGFVDEGPGDCYYSNLDGSFNGDGDSRWGEEHDGPNGGDVDLLPEVAVGRASVDQESELKNFVRKTIFYETHTPSSLAVMAGEYLFKDIHGNPFYGETLKEEIVSGCTLGEHDTAGIDELPNIQIDRLYSNREDWYTSTILGKINNLANPIHFINHVGHSKNEKVMNISTYDVDDFANEQPFFAFSQGCYAGAFDNLDLNDLLLNDAIGEYFVNQEHGAFAVVMNSRYGWGNDDEYWLGSSQILDREFFSALVRGNHVSLGEALNFARAAITKNINEETMRWSYYDLNLLGDPETALKLREDNCHPAPLADAGPDQTISAGQTVVIGTSALQGHGYSWSPAEGLSCTDCAQPTASPKNSTTFTVVARTSCGSSQDSVEVRVVTNQAPVADAGPDQTVRPTDQVSLDGSASQDPDGDSLIFRWSQIQGTQVQLSDSQATKPTFTAPAVTADSILVFSLLVNDGQLDSPQDSVQIIVKADSSGNQPPIVHIDTPTDGQSVSGTVPVAATASDPDGQVVKVKFELPDGSSFTDSIAPYSIKWDSSQVGNGTVTITAVAYDDQGAQSSLDEVSVSVTNGSEVVFQVQILSPQDGAMLSGEVELQAQVTSQNVTQISSLTYVIYDPDYQEEWYDVDAPYQMTWDSTQGPNGDYYVQAVLYAYDSQKDQWIDAKDIVQVTVSN